MQLDDLQTGRGPEPDRTAVVDALRPFAQSTHEISATELDDDQHRSFEAWAAGNGWFHHATVKVHERVRPSGLSEVADLVAQDTRSIPVSTVEHVDLSDGVWKVVCSAGAYDKVPQRVAQALLGWPVDDPER